MYRTKPNYLFNDHDWFSVRQHRSTAMAEEIAAYDGNKLLNTPVEDLAMYFDEKYKLHVPQLREDEIVADQRETEIDVSRRSGIDNWDRGRPITATGAEVEISVPFTGQADAFRIQPSTFTSSPPVADVQGSLLIFKFRGTDLKGEEVRRQFDRSVAEVKQYLQYLERDVSQYNSGLLASARSIIERRREKLLGNQNLVASLGFQLKERDGVSKTYAAPEVRRKIHVQPPQASTAPFEPEPVLDKSHYDHILKVIENMASVMELSPSAFAHMDEEALRTHFLVQLNGHFEGGATGETFNYGGKTDILIRVEGKNVFIGECKFWAGPKKLTETLDQVLSYSSWRDTKVAILIFNKNKDFSAVLESIAPIIESHPNHKRTIGKLGESKYQFVMSHRNDDSREMILTVLAFDVPREA